MKEFEIEETQIPADQVSAIIGAGFPPALGDSGDVVFAGGALAWGGRWHLRDGRLLLDLDPGPVDDSPGVIEQIRIHY